MCCRFASSKVKEITDKVKNSLEKDKKKRLVCFYIVFVLKFGFKLSNRMDLGTFAKEIYATIYSYRSAVLHR